MRFRKTITICKGLKLNLSKSGVSATAGIPGLSINVGKKGAYLNTSIPGTGLYDRHKLFGGNKKTSKKTVKKTSTKVKDENEDIEFSLAYNDDGKVEFFNQKGQEIDDAATIKAIKASAEYEEELTKLNKETLDEYENETDKIINIAKFAKPVYPLGTDIKYLQQNQFEPYERQEYDVPEPTVTSVYEELEKEAAENVNSVMFWKKDDLIKEYVDEHIDERYSEAHEAWLKDKLVFIEQEDENERQYLKHFENKTDDVTIKKLIANDSDALDECINNWVADNEFPLDFDIQFDQKGTTLYVDLDLPEIEDMLTTKLQVNASGIIKEKDKSQKEIKQDYANCAFSLAIFFASNIFNVGLALETIVLSGYTQRRDEQGDLSDDYIYSIKFTRDEFTKFDYNDAPKDICMRFENRCNLSATKQFKVIEPYE